MKTITQIYHIKAPIEKVWQALVDPKIIDKWGGGKAVMDERVGTKFSLWDGDIHGINKEVILRQILVQEWYGGEWESPSTVTFTLIAEANGTRVDLLHENIPDHEVQEIDEGWQHYYLGPLKKLLEG